MANELATKGVDFSTSLTTELEAQRSALPNDFNVARFVQNSVALLNGNETLANFAKQNGTSQIKQGLLRGAYLGLDALNAECYLVPYGKQLNFMPSYKGDVKLVRRYSTRPIKDIYAKLVREGDVYEEIIDHGVASVNFRPLPFNDGEIKGAFAVCVYEDGSLIYDSMSLKDLENTRSASKAKNSPAWEKFTGQMYIKTVLHRLCKHIPIDMDAKGKAAFDSGTEVETDPVEAAKNEIAEAEANSEEFVFDMNDSPEQTEMTFE